MARPRSDYRNEVKTRLSDEEYDALVLVMRQEKLASIAEALRDSVRRDLFGRAGTVAAMPGFSSHGLAHFGTETHA